MVQFHYWAQHFGITAKEAAESFQRLAKAVPSGSAVGEPKEKIRIEPVDVPVPDKTPAPVEAPAETPVETPVEVEVPA